MYALGTTPAVLFAAQLLRGFSYALYVSGRYRYIARLAPRGLEGGTQALVNTVSAVTNLLAAAAGGFLLEALGTRPFFGLLCALQMLSVLFFIGFQAFGIRCLHRKAPDPECLLPGLRGGEKQ